MITDTLDRMVAQSIGHKGILSLMRRRHPHALIVSVAYDPTWSADSEAWAYGDIDNVRIELTGKPTRAIGNVANCSHGKRSIANRLKPYSWRDVIDSL